MLDEVRLKTLFLQLLRNAIWDSVPDTASFPLSDREWQWIYATAARHTLSAVIFDVVAALPEALRPAQPLFSRWEVDAVGQEAANNKQLRTVNYLYARFLVSGLVPVVLKGMALSVCYPFPSHRYASDIDLFYGSVSNKNAADSALEEWGIPVARQLNEESICVVGDVVVENHGHLFLSNNPLVSTSARKRLEETLLTDEAYQMVDVLGSDIKTLCPALAFLQLACHSYKHVINSGIGLRQMTDMALFLKKEHDNIQTEELKQWLSDWKMTSWSRCLMTTLCRHLGMPSAYSPLPLGSERDADVLMNEIWLTANLGQTDARFAPSSGATRGTTLKRLLHLYRLFGHYSYGESTGSLFRLTVNRMKEFFGAKAK